MLLYWAHRETLLSSPSHYCLMARWWERHTQSLSQTSWYTAPLCVRTSMCMCVCVCMCHIEADIPAWPLGRGGGGAVTAVTHSQPDQAVINLLKPSCFLTHTHTHTHTHSSTLSLPLTHWTLRATLKRIRASLKLSPMCIILQERCYGCDSLEVAQILFSPRHIKSFFFFFFFNSVIKLTLTIIFSL